MPGNSNQDRVQRLEEAFMLFAALLLDESSATTVAEKDSMARRLADLLNEIRAGHV